MLPFRSSGNFVVFRRISSSPMGLGEFDNAGAMLTVDESLM